MIIFGWLVGWLTTDPNDGTFLSVTSLVRFSFFFFSSFFCTLVREIFKKSQKAIKVKGCYLFLPLNVKENFQSGNLTRSKNIDCQQKKRYHFLESFTTRNRNGGKGRGWGKKEGKN
eukprot:TRINITY_DN7738_c0_g1_i1.p1 TRINITY_DN7738_c0_g1~~TRINITY_DN7738_c0_g1_i1.p1  ORF type:complete len:116 (+),score=8.50 TRINITY_DN7738_c0_g1_i1:196-543(+)